MQKRNWRDLQSNMTSPQTDTKICALALLIVVSFCITHYADGETIGVCYGMLGNNLPGKADAVNLVKSRRIGKVRIYEANHEALEALKNSGVEVIVGVGNDELQKIGGDQAAANGWVNDNIRPYIRSVNIKYIAVGNEVYTQRSDLVKYLLPAMKNIQTALRNANLQNNMKVSTPHAMPVLSKSSPPSDGVFGVDMSGILKFLSDNGSPFMAHVYPYFAYRDNRRSIPAEFALFTSAKSVVNDGGRMYKNLFDAMLDSFVSALEKAGQPNIGIVVTESGWPSSGSAVATVDNARTYNNNLIKHVLSTAGTPKRPGRTIETFLFALFNENKKDGSEEERHFGLFEANKNAVYPVNFSP